MSAVKLILVTALLPLAVVLAPIPSLPPAAGHTPDSFLQVTPEVSVLPLGGTLRLKAQLFVNVSGKRTASPAVTTVKINFTESPTTDPVLLSSPTTCDIAPTESSCEVFAMSLSPVDKTFTAFITGHSDADEKRLANADAADAPGADCISAEEGESVGGCRSEDSAQKNSPAQGNEPDGTDVVKASWIAGGVDVVPDDQRLEPGKVATLTVTAYDINGNPAPGIEVYFEWFNLSVNDGDGNNPGPAGQPDDSCTTGPAGTCAGSYTSSKEGVDLFCIWTSEPPPTFAGTNQGGTCDGEGLVDATANDGKPSPATDDQDVVRVVWQRVAAPAPPTPTGYWLVAADGGIFAFGDAEFKGSTGAMKLNQPVVAMAGAPGNKGYWLVASDGGIFAFGDARFSGSTGAIKLNQPVVGMDSTPTGNGYFLVARDGGIFAFGDARFAGSTGALKLNQPIVGMATTPTGRGYWLVASDGGIFSFGDARFHGSTGAITLNQPIVGMAATPTGLGYWLVARDGGIFAFGDAKFHGSTGAIKLNQPMVGMSRTATGQGYRLVASDGGIFAFGDAEFLGSTGATKLNQPMVAMDGF